MNNEFMPEIKYIVGGIPCALYGDGYFYAIFNGNWYKLGKHCFNGNNEECCFVEYPTTTDDGHGYIKVETYKESLYDKAREYAQKQSNREDFQMCHRLGYFNGAIEQAETDIHKVFEWIVDNFCDEHEKTMVKTDDVNDEGIPVEWRMIDSEELYDKIQELLMV